MHKTVSVALLVFLSDVALADNVWQPFAVRSFDGREANAEIALLPVRETRALPNSRLIRVAVIRLRAHHVDHGAAPIVFLSGGPGIPASSLARVPVYFDLFSKLQSVGDVLLIDQRGSGLSVPNLTCPQATLSRSFLSSDEAFLTNLSENVARCSRFWTSGGVDLRGYSTREIAADVESARKAAGAKSVRLLAFSYGSEVAIEFARRWPSRVERIVFASTRAPDTLLKMADVWDDQLASVGRMAGMPLGTMLRRAVADLDATPVNVETTEGTFLVGGIGIVTILRSDLSDARALPNVPGFVRALEKKNYSFLAPRVQQIYNSLRSINLMTLAIDCSSGWSPHRLQQAAAKSRVAIMRNVNLQWHGSVCNAIVGPPGIPAPVRRINAPALFVTGTLDVNAPVAQTEEIRRAFPFSIHIVVENAAHETLPIGSVQKRVIRFLRGEPVATERLTLPPPVTPMMTPAG